MRFGTLQRLFRHEAASGIVLMLASALALALHRDRFLAAASSPILLTSKPSLRFGRCVPNRPSTHSLPASRPFSLAQIVPERAL